MTSISTTDLSKTSTRIAVLTGTSNYATWSFEIKNILRTHAVFAHIGEGRTVPPMPVAASGSGTTPAPDITTPLRHWEQDQDKCWGLIAQTVENQVLRETVDAGYRDTTANPAVNVAITTPKLLWDALKAKFGTSGMIALTMILRDLINNKFTEADTMESQISHFMSQRAVLIANGMTIDNMFTCGMLSLALPQSYKVTIDAYMGTCTAATVSADEIRNRVLEQESAQTAQSGSSAMAMTKGKGVFCNYCKKVHPGGENNCYKKKQSSRGNTSGGKKKFTPNNQNKNNNRGPKRLNVATGASNNTVFLYDGVKPRDGPSSSWMLDSGSTDHITPDRSDLSNYVEYQPHKVLTVGNGDTIKVLGQGSAHINIKIRGQMRHARIDHVQYIPESNHRLLSESLLCEAGYIINRSNSQTELIKQGETQAIGVLRNGQYWLDAYDYLSMNAMTAYNKPISLNLLHQRLGHLHEAALIKTPSQVDGISLMTKGHLSACEPCIFGKQARSTFPSNPKRTRKPEVLDLAHTDIMESNVQSIGGNKYILTIIDDHSKMLWAYLMKKKDQAPQCIKEWIAMVENQSGKKLKVLRSDNGGEFKNHHLDELFKAKGIVQQYTTAYTPEQNSVAERMNRTIMEKARAMRFESGLAPKFWGEAVKHAVYLINRTPSRVLDYKTPYELWHGHKPNLSNLRIFGCAAYAKIPEKLLKKQDFKSNRMIFLGFEPGSKAFRLYNPDIKQMRVERDVIFNEDLFPAKPKSVSIDLQLSHQDRATPVKKNTSQGGAAKTTASLPNTPTKSTIPFPETPKASPPLLPALLPINEEEEEAQDDEEEVLQEIIPSPDKGKGKATTSSSEKEESAHKGPTTGSGASQPTITRPLTPPKVIGFGRAKVDYTANPYYAPEELSYKKGQALEIVEAEGWTWKVKGPNNEIKTITKPNVTDYQSISAIKRAPPPVPAKKSKPTPTEIGLDFEERADQGTRRSGRVPKPKVKPDNSVDSKGRDIKEKKANVATLLKEPTTYKQAMKSADADKWLAAIEDELSSLKKMGTWKQELVTPPSDRRAVKNKWVFKIKVAPDGTPIRYKARLVAKGFSQIEGIDYEETFSPVARYESFRILMAIAAKEDWEIHQMDVKTAFLNGDLNEEIYMEQPEGFIQKGSEGKALQLLKAIYGLKQASRQWNKKINDTLHNLGFKRLQSDHGLYVKRTEHDIVIIILYVDDLTLIGNNLKIINSVKGELSRSYEMTDLGEISSYLGMRIQRDRKKKIITLDQEQYLKDVLIRFQMQESKPARTPFPAGAKLVKSQTPPELCDKEFKTQYQSIIGSIMYAAIGCRPDLAYAAVKLSSFSSNPDQSHMNVAHHVLRYIRGSLDFKLVYDGNHNRNLIGYSDSCWGGNLEDRKSTTGNCFFLAGGVVTWASKKQPTVALSSVEAEYMAITSAAKHSKWIQKFFKELGIDHRGAIAFKSDKVQQLPLQDDQHEEDTRLHLLSDSQGAIAMANNPVHHQRTKHIDIQHHFIRECVENNNVDLSYLSTEEMVADVFTKALTHELHSKHVAALNLKTMHTRAANIH